MMRLSLVLLLLGGCAKKRGDARLFDGATPEEVQDEEELAESKGTSVVPEVGRRRCVGEVYVPEGWTATAEGWFHDGLSVQVSVLCQRPPVTDCPFDPVAQYDGYGRLGTAERSACWDDQLAVRTEWWWFEEVQLGAKVELDAKTRWLGREAWLALLSRWADPTLGRPPSPENPNQPWDDHHRER